MTPPDIEISKAATKLTADVGIVFRPLGDKNFHESEIVSLITQYYDKLPDYMKASFAPPEILT